MSRLSFLPLLLLLVLFSGFRHKEKPPKKKQPPVQDLGIWEVPEPAALKMIDEYTHCTSDSCHEEKTKFSKRRRNIKRAIFKYYRLNFFDRLGPRVKWVHARYTAADEERYRLAREINPGDERGKVRGYKTKLLRIAKLGPPSQYTSKKVVPLFMVAGYGLMLDLNMFATTRYYDPRSICPPPTLGCG